MNSKQRVHAALRREPVDRVPIFMWFHPETANQLGVTLGIPPGQVADAMCDDVRQTWVNNNHAMEGVRLEHNGERFTDPWGIIWEKEGPFNQIARSPLQEADDSAVAGYHWPTEEIERLLGNMDAVLGRASEFFIGCDVSPCLFEMVNRLRGMEQALLDLAARRDLAICLLDGAYAFAAELATLACERYPLDWLWTGDDVAGQQAMMMSPTMWRDLLKPRLRELFAIGKRHGLWVAYHSCGSIRPIIPDLIEMGLDVLNPIQCNCPGMEPLELKKEYGDRLAFMGGVDTQGLLPRGTAAEVRRATERLLDGMCADGGGYILAASHTIPPETPLENIFAMYEVAGISRGQIEERAAEIREQIHGAEI